MILLNFGTWNNGAGFLFKKQRIYIKGKWTPFVEYKIRYKDKKQRRLNLLWGLGLLKTK